MLGLFDYASSDTNRNCSQCSGGVADQTEDGNAEKLSRRINSIDSIDFYFSGDKNRDLVSLVVQSIHVWKQKYGVSIPDGVLVSQLVALYSKMKEVLDI